MRHRERKSRHSGSDKGAMAQSFDHEFVSPAQTRKQIAEPSIGACQHQIAEKRRRPCIAGKRALRAGR
jgi:hypothetical protein